MKRIFYTFLIGVLWTAVGFAQTMDLTLNSGESGTKVHQARNSITFAAGYSYTPNGGTLTTQIVDPIVTGDTEYENPINPSTYSIHTSLPVGKTPGQLDVAGFANYSIPLDLPKGTAGLQPSVSLNYISSFNDGPLGVGWNIGGLSAISRVGQNHYYDGKAEPIKGNLSDKYELDGKRLVLTGGTYGASSSIYGTEIEQFSKIVASGTTGSGPEYFTVYTKSGLIYEYGKTTDSKVKRDGSCILKWKLNKISDRYNNYINFTYFDSDDEHLIYHIEYTGNSSLGKSPFAEVNFSYKNREDKSTYVYGGREFQRRLLLDEVEVKNNGQTYKKYQMEYMIDNYAQLNKVTEVTSGNQLLNPTVFAWTDQTDQLSEATHYSSSTKERFYQGDFNGDGRTDFVTVPAKTVFSTSDKWKLYFANSSGNMIYQTEGSLNGAFKYFMVADFNGDGMDDLIYVALTGTFDFYFSPSNGNGFDNMYLGSHWMLDNTYKHHHIVDYNGDGKLEIMVMEDPTWDGFLEHTNYELYTYDGNKIFDGGGFYGTQAAFYNGSGHYNLCDLNGDGCSDILSLFDDGYIIHEFKGSDGHLIQTSYDDDIINEDLYRLGDFNGDGKTDIVKVSNYSTNPRWSLLSLTKDGFKEFNIQGLSKFNMYGETNQCNAIDVNADGKMDIVFWGKGEDINNPSNRINIAINKGNGYEYEITEYISSVNFKIELKDPGQTWEAYEGTMFFYFGDYNGDGREEFFYREPMSNTSKRYTFASGTPSNLLSNIIDGYGAITRISYLPMSSSTIYTRGTGANYPLSDYSSGMQLVYKVDADDGLGGTIGIAYKYEGAKVHLQGKGFVGFAKKTKTVEETGIKEESTFEFHSSKYFPKLTSIITKYSSTSLKTVTNIWSEKSLTYNRIFPYASTITETDNQRSTTVTTTADYNSYGNPTSIAKNFGGGHTKTTTFAYNNERVSSWLIGRPTTISETSVRDSETKTFNISRTYFSTNNSPDIDYYNSGDAAYWKLDREYDGFGNLKKEHKETTGLSRQTTIYDYDTSHGVNLLKVTDPLLNETVYTYDSKTGKVKTVTDPNGNLVTYNYNSADQLSSIVPDAGVTTTITTSFSLSGAPSNARFSIQETGNDGSYSKTWYDRIGRELRTENENLSGIVKVDKQYNYRGRLYRVSEPTTGTPSKWNTIGYDTYGRINSNDPYFGATATFSYSGQNTTKSINSRNYISTVDAAGLVTEREDPGGTIEYKYWPDGTLKSTKAPVGIMTTMTYDKNGNRLTIDDPSAGLITNTYYGTGQVKTVQNDDGQTTTYTYQSNGLLDYYDAPEGRTDYTYNSDNKISSITSPGGVTRSYTYDSRGRIGSITESIGSVSNTISFSYDSKGRLQRRYFNGGADYEEYVYNTNNGYLYRILFNGTPVWQASTMDAYGRITQSTKGLTSCSSTYSSTYNTLTQIKATGVQQYDYSFDVNTGNLNSRTNSLKNKMENFAYDTNKLDRLTSVFGPANLSIAYTSDKNGNIESKSDAGTYSYSTSQPYAIEQISNAQNISTDRQDLEFYSFEKVKKITKDSMLTAEFDYNANYQRIRMVIKDDGTTTKTRWYFDSCEREEIGSTINQYIWIGGDAYTAVAVAKKTGTGSWTIYNIFRDHLGTITHLKTGSTVTEYSFDSWGRRRDKDTWSYTLDSEPALFADRGFTAHEHLTDFDLINMNGRLYDPVVGRFLSPDPHIQSPDFTQSYNRYSYCLNNPLKYNDPSGENWWGVIGPWITSWFGNYVINWMDNTINKDMSPKDAFKQTPFLASGNFSPSEMSFSNYQVDAFRAAKAEENFIDNGMPAIMQKMDQAFGAESNGGETWYYGVVGSSSVLSIGHSFIYNANAGMIYEINHPSSDPNDGPGLLGSLSGLSGVQSGNVIAIGYSYDMNDANQRSKFWNFRGGRTDVKLIPVYVPYPERSTMFFEYFVGKSWDYSLLNKNCKYYVISGLTVGGVRVQYTTPTPNVWNGINIHNYNSITNFK